MTRKRTKQNKFFLDEMEQKKFEKLVIKSKLNKSEYIRKCVFDKEIIIIDDLKELVKEVNKIGVNINQIAKKINTSEGIDQNLATENFGKISDTYEKVFDEIFEVLRKVNK